MSNILKTIVNRSLGVGLPPEPEIEQFGSDGEEIVYRMLCESFDCVIRNVVVPHKKLYLEKDFLVTVKNVPFVIEVKNWKGEIGEDGGAFYQNKDNGVRKTLKSPVGTTKQFIDKMRANLLPSPEYSDLEKYDIYRVYLKSPGPCHSSGFITVPKGAKPKSLPIHFVFDGYGVYSAEPILNPERITVHCTHHGYELGEHRDNYYVPLNQTVCHYYGRGINEINAGYDDISDCYMTYLLIRDLQMVHFATTPELCKDIQGLCAA